MRRGENPSAVLERGCARRSSRSNLRLADDQACDRCRSTTAPSWSTRRCTRSATTCSRAALLVTLVLFVFLLDLRAALIVAVLIPLSLLASFIYLKLRGMSANLLSMGAVDFGIIVDGGVVIIESILVALAQRPPGGHGAVGGRAHRRRATKSVVRPTVFALLIIIAAYLPIFMLQRVEGRIFSPMANTVVAALVGALFFSVTSSRCSRRSSTAARPRTGSRRCCAWRQRVYDPTLRLGAASSLAHARRRGRAPRHGRGARAAPRHRVPARAERGRAVRRPSPCRRTSR